MLCRDGEAVFHDGPTPFVLLEALLGPATRVNQDGRCRSYGRVSWPVYPYLCMEQRSV